MKNIYLVYFDFDGTLLSNEDSHLKDITKINFDFYNKKFESLNKIKNQIYILCTGRTFKESKIIVKKLKFLSNIFFISDNGHSCLINNKKINLNNNFDTIFLKIIINKLLNKLLFLKLKIDNNQFHIGITTKNIAKQFILKQIFNNLKQQNLYFNKKIYIYNCNNPNLTLITTKFTNKFKAIKKINSKFEKIFPNLKFCFFGDGNNDFQALSKSMLSFTFDSSEQKLQNASNYILSRKNSFQEIILFCQKLNLLFDSK